MNCPVCNAPNIAGATFCDNCGTKLGAQSAPPPVPIQAPVPATQAGGMACPSCQSPVIPGTAFCDICGAAIPSVAPAPAAAPQPQPMPVAPAQQPGPAGQVRCGSCGAMNAPGQAFCDNCGQSLRAGGPGPSPVGPVGVPQGPVVPSVRLTVAASGVAFDLTGKTQAIIGRADPVSGVNPDVDLTPHGGDEGGVSRRHAELSFNGYQWQIKDLNSTNGTAVNNQRLSPNVPQPLNSGDQVRVGKVSLVFQAG